jgi:hypothetical protein
MLACSFLAKPCTKNASEPMRNKIRVRNPPDLPPPLRATRCLMTPPPKSASSNPLSASLTDLQRLTSSIPDFLANRVNALFLNIRSYPVGLFHHSHLLNIALSTIVCKKKTRLLAAIPPSLSQCRENKLGHIQCSASFFCSNSLITLFTFGRAQLIL